MRHFFPPALPKSLRTPADRMFARKCQVSGAVCLICYLVLSQTALRLPLGALHTVLEALAGSFFFAELVAVGLLFNRKFDEFQRVLLTRSFVWATVVTMGLTTIWGFVELGSHGTAPHIQLVFLPIFLIVATALAKVFFFRQNRPVAE